MTICAVREITPHVGREELAESRVRRAAGVMARHGAYTRIFKVIAGADVGDYILQTFYSSFTEGATAFQKFGSDPEFQAIYRERASNPAGDIRGPNVYRMVYGGPTKPPRPFMVQRMYHMQRNNIGGVMELAPQLDKLMQSMDVSIGIVVPAAAEDHEMMAVVYRFHSMDHWGESVDKMVDNDEFQSLVAKGNELGTLKTSRIMSTI